MKLADLIDRLIAIQNTSLHRGDETVDLLIETDKGQQQFPMTDLAVSQNSKGVLVILISEPEGKERGG